MSSIEGALRDEIEGLRGQLKQARTEMQAWRSRFIKLRDSLGGVEVVIDKSRDKPRMLVPPGWTETLPTDIALLRAGEGVAAAREGNS
jgi:hypothetical protein